MPNEVKLDKGRANKVIGLATKIPALAGDFNKIATERPDEMSPQRLQEYKVQVSKFRQRMKV